MNGPQGDAQSLKDPSLEKMDLAEWGQILTPICSAPCRTSKNRALPYSAYAEQSTNKEIQTLNMYETI